MSWIVILYLMKGETKRKFPNISKQIENGKEKQVI